MNGLKSYIYALALISVSAGVVGILCPGKEREGLRRWVDFLTGLAVCCVLLAPVKSILHAVPEWIDGLEKRAGCEEETAWDAVSMYIDAASERMLAEAEEGVCAAHGLRPEQVRIEAELDASDPASVRVKKAQAVLSGVDSETAGVIREELEKMFMSSVTVVMTDREENGNEE